jgi:hypothetical protein
MAVSVVLKKRAEVEEMAAKANHYFSSDEFSRYPLSGAHTFQLTTMFSKTNCTRPNQRRLYVLYTSALPLSVSISRGASRSRSGDEGVDISWTDVADFTSSKL